MSEGLAKIDTTEEETEQVVDDVQQEDVATEEVSTEEEGSEEKLFAGKYKSAEELEEGYKNLSQKLREKSPEAPEEYSFDPEALGDDYKDVKIDKDDPLLQHMTNVFKDTNLSDEQATRLAAEFSKYQSAETPNPEKEMEKLGESAKETIGKVEGFFKKYGASAGLTEEEVQQIGTMTATAEGVTALSKLIDRFNSTNEVPENANSIDSSNDPDDLWAQANEIRQSDPSFSDPQKRAKYQRLTRRAAELKAAQK